MAANYWESSQRRHWQFTREGLEDLRKKLEDEDLNLVQAYPLPQLRHLSIYFNQRRSHAPCTFGISSMRTLLLMLHRNCKTWKTSRRATASDGDGPAVHSPILFQGRDQADESLLGTCNCCLSCVQDGGMPTSYQACCERRTYSVARFELSKICLMQFDNNQYQNFSAMIPRSLENASSFSYQR